jgi:hypothetical protein
MNTTTSKIDKLIKLAKTQQEYTKAMIELCLDWQIELDKQIEQLTNRSNNE